MDDRWDLIPQMCYDTAQIKKAIRIEDAIKNYMGVEPNRAGFIKCPDPTHPDKKPSCKVYKKTNSCKCFSCNGYFTVFDLAAFAKGMDIKNDFPKLCEEICNDFGIDKYSVSNLRDRELAIEQVFGEDIKKKEYKEFFPLTETELNLIGLFNDDSEPKKEDFKHSLDADIYFKEFLGFKTISEIPESMLESYHLDVENEKLCRNGKPAKIPLTFNEAVEMGFEEPYEEQKKSYKPFPRIQDLWKNEEDRKGIEEMILGHFREAYAQAKNDLKEAKAPVEEYLRTHDLERERKLCDSYEHRKENHINFSSSQLERINEYASYYLSNMALEKVQESFDDYEKIHNKLFSFYQRRAEHEAEEEETKDKDLER